MTNKQQQVLENRIDKLCSLITDKKRPLPLPSSGDCWYCLLHDENNTSMGDLSKDTGHLLAHIKEKYLHGSLLVNAMRESGYTDEQIMIHFRMRSDIHLKHFSDALKKYLVKRLLPKLESNDNTTTTTTR